jgi:hypothetical protein
LQLLFVSGVLFIGFCSLKNILSNVHHLGLLKKERNETVSNCHQLKLNTADGKICLTNIADTKASN